MQTADGMMSLFPAHVDCERSLNEIYDRTTNEVSLFIKVSDGLKIQNVTFFRG